MTNQEEISGAVTVYMRHSDGSVTERQGMREKLAVVFVVETVDRTIVFAVDGAESRQVQVRDAFHPVYAENGVLHIKADDGPPVITLAPYYWQAVRLLVTQEGPTSA